MAPGGEVEFQGFHEAFAAVEELFFVYHEFVLSILVVVLGPKGLRHSCLRQSAPRPEEARRSCGVTWDANKLFFWD